MACDSRDRDWSATERQGGPVKDQKAEEAQILPRAFRESRALPLPWLQPGRLQLGKTAASCCFQPPGLWYFVLAPYWPKHILLSSEPRTLTSNSFCCSPSVNFNKDFKVTNQITLLPCSGPKNSFPLTCRLTTQKQSESLSLTPSLAQSAPARGYPATPPNVVGDSFLRTMSPVQPPRCCHPRWWHGWHLHVTVTQVLMRQIHFSIIHLWEEETPHHGNSCVWLRAMLWMRPSKYLSTRTSDWPLQRGGALSRRCSATQLFFCY
jgi:hypothetical protein